MEIDIIKIKILDMLTLDDEPLNLILEEVKNPDELLKEPYKNIDISREEIMFLGSDLNTCVSGVGSQHLTN